MKLLHWHKLANEAALKAALIRSKRQKAKDSVVIKQTQEQQERALWIQKTLEEEQQRPLQVTDDFVRAHKEREAKDEERLAAEVRVSVVVVGVWVVPGPRLPRWAWNTFWRTHRQSEPFCVRACACRAGVETEVVRGLGGGCRERSVIVSSGTNPGVPLALHPCAFRSSVMWIRCVS